MGKPIVVLFSVAALAGFAATNAGATPPVAPMSGVEQVRLICNEWGRCWRQPDYYRPYGYYRRYGDDDWRYRRYREDTATMADVMRAVTAGGDAVGIATTIDPEEQPPRQQKARRNGGLFRSTVRSARRRDARSAWSGHGRLF
jgi:hypothetical protein